MIDALRVNINKILTLFLDGHLCPQEIPNGYIEGGRSDRSDYENRRAEIQPKCNDGFRNHRTMVMECVAGVWETKQERFGLGLSSLCIPETDENTWFLDDYFKNRNTE